MDVVNDVSPYWLADPLTADANARQVHDLCLGDGEPMPFTLPCCPIPAFTPDMAGGEHARRMGLFTLPYPYLPDVIWMRRPGENLGVYQLRLALALDLLGLIDEDGTGMIRFAILDGMPASDEECRKFADEFDRLDDDGAFHRVRMLVESRMRDVWPDGYDFRESYGFANELAVLSMRGSVVLAAHTALMLGREGDGERAHAVDMLKRMRETYGQLFNPTGMDPASVESWMRGHASDATGMLEQLVDAGLEDPRTLDAARRLLDTPTPVAGPSDMPIGQ